MSEPESPAPPSADTWLLRLPRVFSDHSAEILEGLGVSPLKWHGSEMCQVRPPEDPEWTGRPERAFLRWLLPLHHTWPCQPRTMDGFVEKAARTLAGRFGPLRPQALLVGPLEIGSPDPWFRRLASNLRGRLLQLMEPPPGGWPADPEAQDPRRASLFCHVGRSGLFAGLASPREANGFHPGGSLHVRQSGPEAISRAGAKIAEALHLLRLHRPAPAPGSRWLELGASPGGMSAELLRRGLRVTAIDRAPPDPRIASHPLLDFHQGDVATYSPAAEERFDALLCDLNGDPLAAIRHVARLSRHLATGAPVVFTLKTPDLSAPAAILARLEAGLIPARAAGLSLIAATHLTYNRRELTLLLEKSARHEAPSL